MDLARFGAMMGTDPRPGWPVDPAFPYRRRVAPRVRRGAAGLRANPSNLLRLMPAEGAEQKVSEIGPALPSSPFRGQPRTFAGFVEPVSRPRRNG